VLTLGFGVRFLSTIRGLKRKYEAKAGVKLSISSFYERFTPKMVGFLQRCVLHAIESRAQQPDRVLGDKYSGWDPGSKAASCSSISDTSSTFFFDRIARYGGYFVSKLIFKELESYYRMDLIPGANPEPVECMIWIAILTLMCSRKILRLIQNANCSLCTTFTPARDAIPMSNERG